MVLGKYFLAYTRFTKRHPNAERIVGCFLGVFGTFLLGAAGCLGYLHLLGANEKNSGAWTKNHAQSDSG